VILFVRHGETEANRQRLALGRADPALTERGVEQADALAGRLASLEVATVYASPLLRARQTAAPIAAAVGAEVVVDDRLIELDYGEWDGRSFPDLPKDELARWRTDPTFAPPGGESLRTVATRGASEELGWRMFLDLASITRIAGRNGQASLIGYNDISHLLS
jgi:broad specificity phosphatase PhoE